MLKYHGVSDISIVLRTQGVRHNVYNGLTDMLSDPNDSSHIQTCLLVKDYCICIELFFPGIMH